MDDGERCLLDVINDPRALESFLNNTQYESGPTQGGPNQNTRSQLVENLSHNNFINDSNQVHGTPLNQYLITSSSASPQISSGQNAFISQTASTPVFNIISNSNSWTHNQPSYISSTPTSIQSASNSSQFQLQSPRGTPSPAQTYSNRSPAPSNSSSPCSQILRSPASQNSPSPLSTNKSPAPSIAHQSSLQQIKSPASSQASQTTISSIQQIRSPISTNHPALLQALQNQITNSSGFSGSIPGAVLQIIPTPVSTTHASINVKPQITSSRPIQPKQPQLLPKPHASNGKPCPHPSHNNLQANVGQPGTTPILMNQPFISNAGQNAIVLPQGAIPSQPFLIQQPSGMQLILRPTSPGQSPMLASLPLQGQTSIISSQKTTQGQTVVIPGQTLAAAGQGQTLLIQNPIGAATQNVLTSQPRTATQSLLRFISTQPNLQLQQIQTANGPITIAVPTGQPIGLSQLQTVRPIQSLSTGQLQAQLTTGQIHQSVPLTSNGLGLSSLSTMSIHPSIQYANSSGTSIHMNSSLNLPSSGDDGSIGDSSHKPNIHQNLSIPGSTNVGTVPSLGLHSNTNQVSDLPKPPPKKKPKKKKTKKEREEEKRSVLFNADELLNQAVKEAGIGENDFLFDDMPSVPENPSGLSNNSAEMSMDVSISSCHSNVPSKSSVTSVSNLHLTLAENGKMLMQNSQSPSIGQTKEVWSIAKHLTSNTIMTTASKTLPTPISTIPFSAQKSHSSKFSIIGNNPSIGLSKLDESQRTKFDRTPDTEVETFNRSESVNQSSNKFTVIMDGKFSDLKSTPPNTSVSNAEISVNSESKSAESENKKFSGGASVISNQRFVNTVASANPLLLQSLQAGTVANSTVKTLNVPIGNMPTFLQDNLLPNPWQSGSIQSNVIVQSTSNQLATASSLTKVATTQSLLLQQLNSGATCTTSSSSSSPVISFTLQSTNNLQVPNLGSLQSVPNSQVNSVSIESSDPISKNVFLESLVKSQGLSETKKVKRSPVIKKKKDFKKSDDLSAHVKVNVDSNDNASVLSVDKSSVVNDQQTSSTATQASRSITSQCTTTSPSFLTSNQNTGPIIIPPGQTIQKVQTIQLSAENQQMLKAVQTQIQKLFNQKNSDKQLLQDLISAQNKILSQGKILSGQQHGVTVSQTSQARCTAVPLGVSPIKSCKTNQPIPANIQQNSHLANILNYRNMTPVSTNSVRYYHHVGNQVISLNPQQKGSSKESGINASKSHQPTTLTNPSPQAEKKEQHVSNGNVQQRSLSQPTVVTQSQKSSVSVLPVQSTLPPVTTLCDTVCDSQATYSAPKISTCTITLTTTSPPVHTQPSTKATLSTMTIPINSSCAPPVAEAVKPTASVDETCSVNRKLMFEHELASDQEGALNPDYKTPFENRFDACKRLLHYHVFNETNQSLNTVEQDDQIFESTARSLLDKFNLMLNKYQYLLLQDSKRNVSSSEKVMLGRMWISDERKLLAMERQQTLQEKAAGSSSCKYLHYNDQQSVLNQQPVLSYEDKKDLKEVLRVKCESSPGEVARTITPKPNTVPMSTNNNNNNMIVNHMKCFSSQHIGLKDKIKQENDSMRVGKDETYDELEEIHKELALYENGDNGVDTESSLDFELPDSCHIQQGKGYAGDRNLGRGEGEGRESVRITCGDSKPKTDLWFRNVSQLEKLMRTKNCYSSISDSGGDVASGALFDRCEPFSCTPCVGDSDSDEDHILHAQMQNAISSILDFKPDGSHDHELDHLDASDHSSASGPGLLNPVCDLTSVPDTCKLVASGIDSLVLPSPPQSHLYNGTLPDYDCHDDDTDSIMDADLDEAVRSILM